MVVLERRAKRHRYLRLSFDGMGTSNNTTYTYEAKADEQKCLSYREIIRERLEYFPNHEVQV